CRSSRSPAVSEPKARDAIALRSGAQQRRRPAPINRRGLRRWRHSAADSARCDKPASLCRCRAVPRSSGLAAGVLDGCRVRRAQALRPGRSVHRSRADAQNLRYGRARRPQRFCAPDSWLKPLLDRTPDIGGNVFRRAAGIDQNTTLRICRRDVTERLAQSCVECIIEALEAVFMRAAARSRAFQSLTRIKIKHQRQIGRELSERRFLQAIDGIDADTARHALIDIGRIREAVRDHPIALGQRGLDNARHVIDASGKKQQCLGQRRPPLGFTLNEQLADFFGTRRAAGLARERHAMAPPFQGRFQQTSLSGFAGALSSFETDEVSAPLHYTSLLPKISACRPIIMLSRKPLPPMVSADTTGTTLSGLPGTATVIVPTCWPAVIGARSGPS